MMTKFLKLNMFILSLNLHMEDISKYRIFFLSDFSLHFDPQMLFLRLDQVQEI